MFSGILTLATQGLPKGVQNDFEVVGDSLLQWWLSTNAKEVNEALPFLRKLQELIGPDKPFEHPV